MLFSDVLEKECLFVCLFVFYAPTLTSFRTPFSHLYQLRYQVLHLQSWSAFQNKLGSELEKNIIYPSENKQHETDKTNISLTRYANSSSVLRRTPQSKWGKSAAITSRPVTFLLLTWKCSSCSWTVVLPSDGEFSSSPLLPFFLSLAYGWSSMDVAVNCLHFLPLNLYSFLNCNYEGDFSDLGDRF